MNKSAVKLKVPTHQKCWAKDCGHRQDTHNCAFSAFPRNPVRCKQWLKVVGVKDFVGLPINKLSTLRFICSCHFQLDDYKLIKSGKRLNENAIPSIFSENTIPLTEADLVEFSPNASSVIPTCSFQVPVKQIIQSNQFSFHSMFNRLKTEGPIESTKSISNDTRGENQLVPMEAIQNQQSQQDELQNLQQTKVLSMESIAADNSINGALISSPSSTNKKRSIRSSGAAERNTKKLIMDEVDLTGANISPCTRLQNRGKSKSAGKLRITSLPHDTDRKKIENKKEDPEPEIDQRNKTEMFPSSNVNTETADMEIVEITETIQDIDETIEILSSSDSSVNTEIEFVEIGKEVPNRNQCVQANFFSKSNENTTTFICNRYRREEICDVQIQTEINIFTRSLLFPNKFKEVNKESGPVHQFSIDNETQTQNINIYGFASITEDRQLAELTGVNFKTFEFLLKKFCNKERSKISHKDRLLIFLMKIKLGLTFDALGVLFNIQGSAISNIFFGNLASLVKSTENVIFWPDVNVAQKLKPPCFYPKYSDTRVIIDCLEFQTEALSSSKKSVTAKVLLGITPEGSICFKSKVAFGEKSHSQMTIESGLLDLLQDGDIILANNEFPEIKKAIDTSGRKVEMIVPPLLEKRIEIFKEEPKETCHVPKVRVHVDRILERLKSCQILNKISEELFLSMDDIMHICCVLVTLQTSVLLNKKTPRKK